jgi:hypothetical protein
MSLARGTNYHTTLQKQEDIIRRHYSAPIYTSITRTTTIPVSRKKLNLKKSIKQKSAQSNDDEDKKDLVKTKKRGDTNFIVED